MWGTLAFLVLVLVLVLYSYLGGSAAAQTIVQPTGPTGPDSANSAKSPADVNVDGK